MSQYAHPEMLVDTAWAGANLKNPKVRLVEVDVDAIAFEQGHVPGAVGWNWTTQLCDPVQRDILPKARFENLMAQSGIGNETTVILYGDNNNWFAAWALWEMVIAVNLNTDIIGKLRRPGASIRAAVDFDPLPLLEQSEETPGLLTDSLTRGIFRRGYDRPSIFAVMATSLSIMQDRLTRSRLAGDPPDVHIAPLVGHIGLLDFDRAEELVREGEDAVERRRPELIDALQVMGLASAI
jgi:hypothetical protein